MRKLLALTLSLLLVFSLVPMTMASADTMTATHVYTMDAGSRIAGGYTRYHWGAGYADIGGDHGYVFRLETKSDAFSYFTLPANWSTDYGKVTKISFELGGATKGTLYNPAVCLATEKNSNYQYSGTAIRGLWKNVEFKAGSWTTVEIDVSDKDTFFVNGTEARYMCLGAQKALGVQYNSDSAKGWMYIDNVTLTYEYEADLPEYDVTIDGEVVDTVMETKTFTVPTPAEGYHYSDGVVDYFGGEEITVTAPVALVSVINTYDVTVEGTVADTVAHGGTFTVPAPATGYQYSDGANLYDGGEDITVTGPVELIAVVATKKDVYTMDEGKRLPEAKSYAYVAGVDVDRNAEYIEVNGNYKLALKAQMDRCAYIKLPLDWASKPYYKPTKITFTASKDSTGSMAFKTLRFASSVSDSNYAPSGETHDIIASTSYINPTTYTIDVTEDMYDCFYISGQVYSTNNWNPTNLVYLLIDDVTIDYEYDFDYVEPTYYDVTIDGEVVASVLEGDTFTLPAVAEGMQYVDGFVAGQEFVVTEALSFATEKIPEIAGEATEILKTQVGASIRLNEVSGIRFYTSLDVDKLNAFVGDKEYEVGTLIAPKDIAGDYLTIEDDCAKVVYDMSNDLWENDEIVGSLVNIKEKNWARDFVARAYILVDGVYYYSDVQCVRNIAGIADAYISDANGGYESLDVDTKALVDAWAKAND